MSKLFLPGRVPNEGAHCLAYWMLGVRNRELSACRIEEARSMFGDIMLARMLEGDLLPGVADGKRLWLLTGGRVSAAQFRRPTGRRWGEAPGWAVR